MNVCPVTSSVAGMRRDTLAEHLLDSGHKRRAPRQR
jgi:hypothetical protein